MILDIVINTFNKEKTILNVFTKIEEELKGIKHRYIFVDDASTDKTLEILKNIQKKNESSVKIISLSKHHGKESCIYAGLSNTKHDLVCIYDTDLQANTTHINKMYDYLTEHSECDQVCMYANYNEKSAFTRLNINIMNKIYNINIDNNKTYYRMMRKNVVKGIIDLTSSYPFTNYSFELLGFNTYYMKFDNNTISNKNLSKYLCYSNRPLYLFKIISYFLIIIAFIYFVLSILKIIETSNFAVLMFIFVTCIFNLYILSISNKYFTKEKTYFIIKEKIGFDENVL